MTKQEVLQQCTIEGNIVKLPSIQLERKLYQEVAKSLELIGGKWKGEGNFLEYLPNAEWCEISEGKDFFNFTDKVDWIVTNPPWSIFRPFLIHSLTVADNIVFLIPIVHYFGKARLREIKNAGYGFKEMVFIDTPKSFPQMGFQLGVVHIQKNYGGDCKMTWLS